MEILRKQERVLEYYNQNHDYLVHEALVSVNFQYSRNKAVFHGESNIGLAADTNRFKFLPDLRFRIKAFYKAPIPRKRIVGRPSEGIAGVRANIIAGYEILDCYFPQIPSFFYIRNLALNTELSKLPRFCRGDYKKLELNDVAAGFELEAGSEIYKRRIIAQMQADHPFAEELIWHFLGIIVEVFNEDSIQQLKGRFRARNYRQPKAYYQIRKQLVHQLLDESTELFRHGNLEVKLC